jgi:hypothetical protein
MYSSFADRNNGGRRGGRGGRFVARGRVSRGRRGRGGQFN